MAGENWPVVINESAAYASANNLRNSSFFSNTTQPWNYTDIMNMTNVSLTNSTQTGNALFNPFYTIWVQQIFGYWIYVIIIVVIALVTLTKVTLEQAGLAIMLMALVAVVPGATSGVIPYEQLYPLALIAIVGLGITLYGAFTKER